MNTDDKKPAAESTPEPTIPQRKPKKKKEKTTLIPLICLIVSVLLFAFFFIRVFPTTVNSQKEAIAHSDVLTPSLRIEVDPRTAYKTGIVGQDADATTTKSDTTLLLYDMEDGYVLLLVDNQTLKTMSSGLAKTFRGIKLPTLSSDLLANVAEVVVRYDEISAEEAEKIVSKIPCIDLRSSSQNTTNIPAIITALLSGASLFWLLQRISAKSPRAKKRTRSHR